MLIKRYLAEFQCGAYNFRYVFEQHPVSQDSHIDGFHSTQQTQSCSHGSDSKLFKVHLLLWTDCYGSGYVQVSQMSDTDLLETYDSDSG